MHLSAIKSLVPHAWCAGGHAGDWRHADAAELLPQADGSASAVQAAASDALPSARLPDRVACGSAHSNENLGFHGALHADGAPVATQLRPERPAKEANIAESEHSAEVVRRADAVRTERACLLLAFLMPIIIDMHSTL